eukprot:Skav211441  [mRNA]  locus=scaffold1591:265451:273136:- [translate_table: standard]
MQLWSLAIFVQQKEAVEAPPPAPAASANGGFLEAGLSHLPPSVGSKAELQKFGEHIVNGDDQRLYEAIQVRHDVGRDGCLVKPWENRGKTVGKPWEIEENHGKTMESEENGKTMGKPWKITLSLGNL